MGFKLRSGNGPLKFKQMGATPAKNMKSGSYAHKFEDESKDTPAYLKQFGIGEGISPHKQTDWAKMQAEAAKKDPRYAKLSVEEYKKEALRQSAHHAKTGKWDAMGVYDSKGNKKKVEEPDAKETNVTETAADNIIADAKTPEVNKLATAASKVKGGFVRAATGALNAVYGTGIVDDSGTIVFSDKKKKDPDDETPQERATRLASRDATV